MVTKCCYREVILALSRENLVSVLVCRCNLCILSKAPTVLYCTEILWKLYKYNSNKCHLVQFHCFETVQSIQWSTSAISSVLYSIRLGMCLTQIYSRYQMIGGILHNRETPSDLSAWGSCCDAKTYKTSKKWVMSLVKQSSQKGIHGSADFIIILYVLGKKYMVTSNNTRPAKGTRWKPLKRWSA